MHSLLTALAGHRGFVVYRLAPLPNGKTDKRPVDPATGYNSNAQDPATWMTPDVAQAWADTLGPGHGVGIVIYAGSQLFCIDIDACRTGEDWSPHARATMALFPDSPVEVSASGKGLHIFGTYKGPEFPHASKNRHHSTELYTSGRFIALTGNYLREGWVGADCTAALHEFAAAYFPANDSGYVGDWTEEPAATWNFLTDDAELIEWACNHQDARALFGGKASFTALFTADAETLSQFFPSSTGQPYDASSADQALANFFAWATGNNCERTARLMELSALRRPKWEREDYFRGTIAKACAGGDKKWPRRPALTVPPLPPLPPLPDAGTTPAAAPPPEPPREAGGTEPPPRGGIFFTIDQVRWFSGYTYVEDVFRVMDDNGDLLEKKQFDLREPFAGREFQMHPDGSNGSDSAWDAFTAGMTRFPKVRGQYFEPREAPGCIITREGRTYVNSWRPVEIPSAPGDVQWFMDHLAILLPERSHGNDAHILLQYLKFMVQHKGEKAAWFPFLQGVEGNGKSFINETMQYCLGERYTHKPRAPELAGKFNSAFYGKLLIAIDDIQLSDARHIWETLKPMVDGKRLEIEYKGVDKVTREVCFNLIVTSNHQDGIPVTTNDRRVAPFFCAQQNEEDLPRDGLTENYFTKLWDTAQAGGWAAVLHYLQTDPIDPKYNPVVDARRAPRTSSTFAAKASTLGTIEQDVQEALITQLPGFAGGWISSAALDRMLKASGRDKLLSLSKRQQMLATLRFFPHPGLPDGRVAERLTDGTLPRLFVRREHPSCSITDAAAIRAAYISAQQTGAT